MVEQKCEGEEDPPVRNRMRQKNLPDFKNISLDLLLSFISEVKILQYICSTYAEYIHKFYEVMMIVLIRT